MVLYTHSVEKHCIVPSTHYTAVAVSSLEISHICSFRHCNCQLSLHGTHNDCVRPQYFTPAITIQWSQHPCASNSAARSRAAWPIRPCLPASLRASFATSCAKPISSSRCTCASSRARPASRGSYGVHACTHPTKTFAHREVELRGLVHTNLVSRVKKGCNGQRFALY